MDHQEFDRPADRAGTGNMKGLMQRELPAGTVMLYGAEMDYPTAPCIRKALSAFAERGIYGFTLDDGVYREAIADWFAGVRGTEIDPAAIVPTHGTVFGLGTALRAFTESGDGIILQAPSYYRFDNAIRRNGRTVVYNDLREEQGVYTLDLSDLEAKMARPENKLLLLVNPHNPTGRVFRRAELEAIRDLAARYDTIVFSDEIFAETAQPGHPAAAYIAIDPDRGITSCSLGKAFNFTGVNHANLVIPNPDLRERYDRQREIDHFGSLDPFFYNALLAAYSKAGADWLRDMNAHTLENYRLLADTLRRDMPHLRVSPLEGTFVAWIDCRDLGLPDKELEAFMSEKARICADPGRDYGEKGSGFYRWNIATPTENLQKALRQLKTAYDHLINGGTDHV